MAIRLEIITVKRKKRLLVIFYHDKTEDVEIHAVKRWVKVKQEGNAEQYFIRDAEEDAEEDPTHLNKYHIQQSQQKGNIPMRKLSWFGIDNRKSLNIQDPEPTTKGFVSDSITHIFFVRMILLFFPRKFIEDVIIIETNNNLDKRMTLGEFLRWIGIWFFLSTLNGFNRRSFWSSKEVSREYSAPYLFHDWMNRS